MRKLVRKDEGKSGEKPDISNFVGGSSPLVPTKAIVRLRKLVRKDEGKSGEKPDISNFVGGSSPLVPTKVRKDEISPMRYLAA